MTKSLLWDNEYLLSLIDKVDENCFWYSSKSVDIIIDKHRWLDAGMVNHKDANGNDPLADKDSRVSVFTVTSFQQISQVSAPPNFQKRRDDVTVA